MGIMRPPLEQQVSPAPWLVTRANVDVPGLIQQALAQTPDATVDDIVRQLGALRVQVSGIIVSMWMLKLREQEAALRAADDKPLAARSGAAA